MDDRSPPGGDVHRVDAPGSEATPDSLADQQKSERSLTAFRDKTPAEHIGWALAMLGAGEVHPGLAARDPQRVIFQFDDVSAIQGALRLALEQSPIVLVGQPLSAYMAELARSVNLNCRYCGCSENFACTIDAERLAPNDRAAVAAYFAEQGEALPEQVNCWWISLEPPICSNPHCAQLHRATSERVTGVAG